jgi:hypothetical protein
MSLPTTAHADTSHDIELSVVMPCLNEADTLAVCIRKARLAMEQAGIVGEVIVADNGSTDASPEIARAEGARLVAVRDRGYGAALMGGIEAARGRFVIMGDADDSYDFGEVPKFVERLREGRELVQGCRLESGGGIVLPGAMPRLHRWLGNPRCTGMEFATEMIIKASLSGASIAEVPITLHPDGRKSHPPHLNTFRDGWRTLRFFLICTPRRLFLRPGLLLLAAGIAGYTLAMPGFTIGRLTFDAHTLLFASLAVICGYQSMLFSLVAKTFAVTEGLLPADPKVDRLRRFVPLERGLVLAGVAVLLGSVMLLAALNQWRVSDFGRLNYADTMRVVVPGVTLAVLGYQTMLSFFFMSLLEMRRR